jgi:hypothetical protein
MRHKRTFIKSRKIKKFSEKSIFWLKFNTSEKNFKLLKKY